MTFGQSRVSLMCSVTADFFMITVFTKKKDDFFSSSENICIKKNIPLTFQSRKSRIWKSFELSKWSL